MMDAYQLNKIVRDIDEGVDEAHVAQRIEPLDTQERSFVGLATGRNDLLPPDCKDPIEAWFSLDANWRRGVCSKRGWSPFWAVSLVDINSLKLILDSAGIPAVPTPRGDGLSDQTERVQFLVEQRDLMRSWLEQYGGHAEDCPARTDAAQNCECGWSSRRLQMNRMLPCVESN